VKWREEAALVEVLVRHHLRQRASRHAEEVIGDASSARGYDAQPNTRENVCVVALAGLEFAALMHQALKRAAAAEEDAAIRVYDGVLSRTLSLVCRVG
jgi:hypothetical protein